MVSRKSHTATSSIERNSYPSFILAEVTGSLQEFVILLMVDKTPKTFGF
jgi:hypothetical protein